MNILVIGYGNPGRLDDGLGPAFAEQIQQLDLSNVTVESNYQLNIEDADLIAGYETVIFADASVNAVEPFEFRPMAASDPVIGFSSHSITAESLLGLSGQLFDKVPQAYAMAIRGYDFNEFGEQLSKRAEANLLEAIDYFRQWCADQAG